MRVEEERMKESWMDKLIELLNQFEKEKKSWYTWRSIDSYDNCVYWVDCDWETEITMYSDLYSNYYWFIKWLVENDKINLEHLEYLETCCMCWWFVRYWKVDGLIMKLSISSSPIEDLIFYLKK